MFETLKTIKQIKRLRKKPVDREFLRLFRSDLEAFVDANPAAEIAGAKWGLADLFKLKFVQVPLAVLLLLVLAGGGLASASQKSLPGDRLFKVKAMTENIRTFLALSPESKAELQTKFASQRITEIKEILEQRGVFAPGLDVALSRLEDNSRRTQAIFESAKSGGLEIKIEKKTLDDIQANVKNLKSVMDAKRNELSKQEEELKIKIQAAQDSDDSVKLQNEIQEINKHQEQLKAERKKIKSSFEQSRQRMRLEVEIRFDDDEEDNNNNDDGGDGRQENGQNSPRQQGEVRGEKRGPNGSRQQKEDASKQNGQNGSQQQENKNQNSGFGNKEEENEQGEQIGNQNSGTDSQEQQQNEQPPQPSENNTQPQEQENNNNYNNENNNDTDGERDNDGEQNGEEGD